MKRGSALLIVLGMVSFMVISSVAFSMYMRTSRLPSNYLRRSSSSRYLLKAALANAIERIDGTWRSTLDSQIGYDIDQGYIEGIYDDLYPGLNPKGQSTAQGDYPNTGNRWVRRVLTPFVDADPDVTVSTLTLEGLAYLPPALINEVRLQSRRTLTARWSNLTYEFGRYAFCAVDVSDCFDVNKVRSLARTSAGRQRVGFSSLFRKGSRWSDIDTSAANEFNTIANGVGQEPFVSLADFNLVCGSGQFSPFCKYVGQSGGDMTIVKSGDKLAANAFYITDTWFPPTNATTTVKRYTLSGDQPFDDFPEKSGVDDILKDDVTTFGKTFMRERLGGTAMVCLRDYLDEDQIPSSYALPTVETAPMVCALGLQAQGGGLKLSLGTGETREADLASSNPKQKIHYSATARTLKFETESLHLTGLAAFPFKRLQDKKSKGGYKTSFSAKGLVKIFLAPADMAPRVNTSSPLLPKNQWTKSDWGKADTRGILTREVPLTGTITMNKDLPTQAETVQSFEGDVELAGALAPTIFWEITKVTTTYDDEGNQKDEKTEVYYSMDGVAGKNSTFAVYEKDSTVAPWWENLAVKPMFEKDAKTIAVEPTKHADDKKDIDTTEYVPHVAVWVKLQDGDDVVDIVPAYLEDDITWGQYNRSENPDVTDACAQDHPPILRFSSKTPFTFGSKTQEALAKGAGDLDWSVLFTVDPRYNYAPEAWYVPSGVAPSDLQNGEKWLDAIKGILGDASGRDSDIFMFTSDQGYLQAMGELQFLTMVQDIPVGKRSADMFPKWMVDLGTGRVNCNFPYKNTGDVLGAVPWAWRTYSAVDGDPIYNLGDPNVEILSARNDFRMNPFTQDERAFMTVLANTPYDYFVASTNDELNLLGKCDPASGSPKVGDGLKHAFNSQTACAKWSDDADDSELSEICGNLMNRFAKAADDWDGSIKTRPSWESIYDGSEWYDGKTGDDQRSFLGVEMDTPLHAVDRKFLHSFWRECFGNRQQLFLVFIRAEPLTVGGSGTASMGNAQTGARGVALVWRDPEPPLYEREKRPNRANVQNMNSWKKNGKVPAPHRTRVLFYHQFD